MMSIQPKWFICHFCYCPYPDKGMYYDHLRKFHRGKKTTRPALSLSPLSSEVSSPESTRDSESDFDMIPESVKRPIVEFKEFSENECDEASSCSTNVRAVDFGHFKALGQSSTHGPVSLDVKPKIEQYKRLEFLEKERLVNKGCKEYAELVKNYYQFETSTGKLNFQCKIPTCHRVLQSKVSIHQHWRIHSGERPFRCKVCSKSFANLTNMRRHETVLHLNIRKNAKKLNSKRGGNLATADGSRVKKVKAEQVKVKKEIKQKPRIKIETVINDDTWLIESSTVDVIAKQLVTNKYIKSE